MQETWVQSLGWEDPLEEGMAYLLQYSWPGEFYGQRSLAGYSPWVRKEQDITEGPSLSYWFTSQQFWEKGRISSFEGILSKSFHQKVGTVGKRLLCDLLVRMLYQLAQAAITNTLDWWFITNRNLFSHSSRVWEVPDQGAIMVHLW